MSTIDPPLNWPIYEGDALVANLTGTQFPVAIAGRIFLIDPKKSPRTFLDPYRMAYDLSAQPGEQTLTVQGVWSRYGTNWRFGAGQPRYDDKDVSLRTRFNASLGVDPWTYGVLTLLHDTEVGANPNPGETVVRLFAVPGGGTLILQTGHATYWAPGGGLSNLTGFSGGTAFFDVDGDDTHAWIATSTGIYTWAYAGTTAALFGAVRSYDHVLYANGRLTATSANGFYDIDATGVATLVDAHVSTGFRFSFLEASPTFIYAGGRVGSENDVFRFAEDATTGALTKKVPSLSLPGDEFVNTMLYYAGKIVLGTTAGFRFADVDSNGNIIYGSVVDDPGSVVGLYGFGDAVYFTWTNVNGQGRSGVGRIIPGRFGFAEGNVPAWASDLTYASPAASTAVVERNGLPVFAVAGVGVCQRSALYMQSASFTTGQMDFGIPYPFQPLSVTVRTEALPVNTAVTVAWATYGNETHGTLGTHNQPASPEAILRNWPKLRTDGFELTFTLVSDGNATPVLKSWLLQVAPLPQRVEVVNLAIMAYPWIRHPFVNGPQLEQDVPELTGFLSDLVRSGDLFNYQEGSRTYRARAIMLESEPARFAPNNDGLVGEITLQLHLFDLV